MLRITNSYGYQTISPDHDNDSDTALCLKSVSVMLLFFLQYVADVCENTEIPWRCQTEVAGLRFLLVTC